MKTHQSILFLFITLFSIFLFIGCSANISQIQTDICEIKTDICYNAQNICASFQGDPTFDSACEIANSICEYSEYFCDIQFETLAEAEKVKQDLIAIKDAPQLYEANSLAVLQKQKQDLYALKKQWE